MSSGRQSKTENAPRDCGRCNVCCTVMHVRPLDKAAGQCCAHQGPRGCGIYHDRPSVCREWFCMWVRDTRVFCDTHRPDKLGVFFTATAADSSGRQLVIAHEVYPGAFDQTEPQRVINFISQFAEMRLMPARTDARLQVEREKEQPVALTHEGGVLSADAA